MNRYLITAICISFISFNSFSQNSGYKGKRFVLKTDLSSLVDLGGSGSLEVAVARHISLEPEYRYSNKRIKYRALDPDGVYDTKDNKIKYNEHAAFLTLKIFHSKSQTAPKGFYTFIKGGMGRASITGYDYFYEVVNSPDPFENPTSYQYKKFTFKNLRTFHVSAGIGVNYIFAKRLLADIYWGLQYSNVNAKQYNEYLGEYASKATHNVVNFIPGGIGRSKNFGFTFRASFGILLF